MQPVAPRHSEASVKRAASFVLLTIYALITFGCGNSNSNSMLNNPASVQVRVVQGGVNSSSVDVLVNGAKAQIPKSPLMTPLYFAVRGSTIHVEEVPAGTTGPAILDATCPVTASSFNTVMTVGDEAKGTLAALAFVDDHTAPPTGQIKLRIVNGASTIGPVDLYVNNVGEVFPSAPTVAGLTFKSSTAYLPLSASNYQICMMPAGTSPSFALIGIGTPNCSLNLTVDIGGGYRNFTFAIFDPPPPPTGGSPGQFVVGIPFTVLMDLHQ